MSVISILDDIYRLTDEDLYRLDKFLHKEIERREQEKASQIEGMCMICGKPGLYRKDIEEYICKECIDSLMLLCTLTKEKLETPNKKEES